MVPIDLFDLLELSVIGKRGIELSCEGFRVPTDENNLAYQAALSFLSKARIEKGVSIKLTKNIPVAAGLGGGSSDAAATLLTLNEIWSQPLSLSQLHTIAVQLGADVPFFLYSEPSLATGIGEILEPLKKWPKLWYVIVTPPIQVSTSWVYGHLKLELTRGEYDYIVKFLKNAPFAVSAILENDLEEVTSTRFPVIETIKEFLVNAGAEGALMTGSGPSVFGVFSSLNQALSAKQFLISQSLGDVFVATNWEGPKH
jgi:4-diphosphocytidyl-2-C-methyl-D-erythritol kinase